MKLLYKALHSVGDGQYLMYVNANRLKSVYIFEVAGDEFIIIKSAHMRNKVAMRKTATPQHKPYVRKTELKVEEALDVTRTDRDSLSNNDFPIFELSDDEYLMTLSEYI